MTNIEEKYQLSVEAGEKAYNDTEGNLEYAIEAALKHFVRAFADKLEGEEMVEACARAIHDNEIATNRCFGDKYDRLKEWPPFEHRKSCLMAAAKAALAVIKKEIGV